MGIQFSSLDFTSLQILPGISSSKTATKMEAIGPHRLSRFS